MINDYILIIIVIIIIYYAHKKYTEGYATCPIEIKNTSHPILWWFIDVEPNARNWQDFSARKTTEVNRGYLQMSLDALYRTQGDDFTIIPLIGRDAVITAVEGPKEAKQLPPDLWRHYAIAAILNKYGGLVMDGNSTLCVGPRFAPWLLSSESPTAALFGVTNTEYIVSPHTTVAPGPAPYVGWSKNAAHPAWVYAVNVWLKLINAGPQTWSAASVRHTNLYIYEKQKTLGLTILRVPDGSRLANGRERTLEDIFGRISEPYDPKMALLPGTIYITYDGDALERSYEYGWFIRMSKDQIMKSDIIWTTLAANY